MTPIRGNGVLQLAGLDPGSIAILVIGGGIAVAFCWYGIAELRLANRVLRVDPDSVFDATDGGPIELRGTAWPVEDGRTLRSPITDTPCLVYEYEVEEYTSSGQHSSWQTVDDGTEYVPFLLEDDTGRVLIEPPGADFRLERHERIEVDGGTEPPRRIARFIDENENVDCQNTRLDLKVFELKTGNDRRFTERLLEPGEEVHVLGTARYDTTVSKAARQVNAAVGIDEASLSDGRWIRLRHALVGDPFVISDKTTRRLGLRAGAAGLGAVAVGLVAITIAALWAL